MKKYSVLPRRAKNGFLGKKYREEIMNKKEFIKLLATETRFDIADSTELVEDIMKFSVDIEDIKIMYVSKGLPGLITYKNRLSWAVPNKVPKICYDLYGSDLDGCSHQESEGCGRCLVYKRGMI